MRILLFVLLIILFHSCEKMIASQAKRLAVEREGTITAKVVANAVEGYGYEIFQDGQKIIQLPSRPGNKGFKTKEDARKAAEVVMRKIRNGQMPPTLTRKELENILAK